MKSPSQQKIIQIDITNACMHRCSNCTRFCGHHKKPFFMDYGTFKRAVNSLKDFPGMVGIMGGEPTIHPNFERLVKYYASVIEPGKILKHGREPIKNFVKYRNNFLNNVYVKRGLWTSLGEGYYRHFELIQDVFEYQCINDHKNPGLHQSLMFTRKELGIPDEEWIKLRDNCWIQNLWSAAITPKGAFFCEVAAALDMLFDGPGGWPIEPKWWQRTPDEFGDQLRWCEICGAALKTPRRKANDEIDDVGIYFYEKLKNLGSPKLKKGNVNLIQPQEVKKFFDSENPSVEWYLPDKDNNQRIADTNQSLYPKKLTGIVLLNREETDILQLLAAKDSNKTGEIFNPSFLFQSNASQLDKLIVICPEIQKLHFFYQNGKKDNTIVVSYEELNIDGSETIKAVGNLVKKFNIQDWIILINPFIILKKDFLKAMKTTIFNPGCVYFLKQTPHTIFNISFLLAQKKYYLILFNTLASALKKRKHLPDENDFLELWEQDKRIDILQYSIFPRETLTLKYEKEKRKNYLCGIFKSLSDMKIKYAIFGAGSFSKYLFQEIIIPNNFANPVLILDEYPQDKSLYGISILTPAQADHNKFDVIVIGVDDKRIAEKIKQKCINNKKLKAKPQIIPN